MDKRPAVIGGMFDRIAPVYDRLNGILSLSIDRYWRKKAIQALRLGDDSLVLDIATGTGDLALRALRDSGCRVMGIDLSARMLEQAARKAGPYLNTRYFPISGDALTLPFRDDTFDRAMVAFGIRNVIRVDRFLDELARVTRKGGMIAILELSVPSSRFRKKIYFLYFKYILPVLGGIISGDTQAYRYLRDSVLDFLPPVLLAQLCEERGLTVVDSTPLLGGIAYLQILKRDRREEIITHRAGPSPAMKEGLL